MQDTKELLRQTMYELMSKHGLDQITVNDILAEANVSRSTFYRYFQDKYELIQYCYEAIYRDLMSELSSAQLSLYDIHERMYCFVYSKKNFFINAFKYNGQNSLSNFIIQFWIQVDMKRIKAEADKGEVLNRELLDAIVFNVAGQTYFARQWALSGMKEDPREMAKRTFQFYPEVLKSWPPYHSIASK